LNPDSPDPAVARDAAAIGAAVFVFGATFGVLAVAAGLTTAQASAMSLLVFTGASQFAVVGVLDSGGAPAAAVGSALLLAARNGLYGISLSRQIGGGRLRRLVAAQLVIDESTAMATAHPAEAERAFWVTGVSVFVFWNIGTLLGALGGGAIGDPATLGLDAAFPAGFVALMAPHLRRRDGLIAAVTGAVIALLSVPFVPAGVPVLLAAIGVVPGYLAAPVVSDGPADGDPT
jgi:4-azaleucine resistance transporter AzlC